MKRFPPKTRGMTIVETLVAVALMALVALSATSLIASLASRERKNRSMAETEWQATYAMDVIAASLRNATSVTAPLTGVTASSLTIAMATVPAENPTVYSLSGGRLLVSKAGGAAVPLSSDAVTVTSLSFRNVTASGTDGAVRVAISVASDNLSGRAETAYSTSRQTTVTLR